MFSDSVFNCCSWLLVVVVVVVVVNCQLTTESTARFDVSLKQISLKSDYTFSGQCCAHSRFGLCDFISVISLFERKLNE